MELFREFFSVTEAMNQEGLAYSVVGGLALAFHSQPRFTRDIDILARPLDLPRYRDLFARIGYTELSEPWTFKNTQITLYRFGKHSVEDDEEMIVVDLLVGHEERHQAIIDQSVVDESPVGKIRVATRADLIWMKKIRGSKQDEADIEKLEAKDG